VAAVRDLFAADLAILAMVHVFRHPFTDELTTRPDVELIHVTTATRDTLPRRACGPAFPTRTRREDQIRRPEQRPSQARSQSTSASAVLCQARSADLAGRISMVKAVGLCSVRTDLKDLPDAVYPPESFRQLLNGADLTVISTIGFAPPAATGGRRECQVPIAVDVQAIDREDDPYLAEWP
jgi:hypothetical protein